MTERPPWLGTHPYGGSATTIGVIRMLMHREAIERSDTRLPLGPVQFPENQRIGITVPLTDSMAPKGSVSPLRVKKPRVYYGT